MKDLLNDAGSVQGIRPIGDQAGLLQNTALGVVKVFEIQSRLIVHFTLADQHFFNKIISQNEGIFET